MTAVRVESPCMIYNKDEGDIDTSRTQQILPIMKANSNNNNPIRNLRGKNSYVIISTYKSRKQPRNKMFFNQNQYLIYYVYEHI